MPFWPSFTKWATRPGPWDTRAVPGNGVPGFRGSPFQAMRTQAWPANEGYGAELEDYGPPPRGWVAVTQGRGGNAADGIGVLLASEDNLTRMQAEALLRYTNGLPLTRPEEELLFNMPLPPVQVTRPRMGVGAEVAAYDIPVTQTTDHLPYIDQWKAQTLERARALTPSSQSMRVANMRSAVMRRAEFGDD